MSRQIAICLLLAGITLFIYSPTVHYQSVLYDDPSFINAPEVLTGVTLQSLEWALTTPVAANWHPITTFSFVLSHQMFGFNPGAEHLINVFIHALNASLLFIVLLRTTQLGLKNVVPPSSIDPTWPCAITAALFAWHPLRVESVAWISERKDVLCAFFMLLTIWAYLRYVTSTHSLEKEAGFGPTNSFWLALTFFTLGLMSKSMIVTLPFILLLLDVWPLRSIPDFKLSKSSVKPLIVEKIPFFALSGVFCVITFLVQRHSEATPSLQQLSLGLRLENVVVSYWRYLAWTLWPAHLAAFYTFPYNSQTYHFYLALWPLWEIVLGALALLAISVACFKLLARQPCLAVGWFWYLGTLVPVIGFVQVGSQGMADRYTYIPLIGPVFAIVWLISNQWEQKRITRGILAGVAVIILFACAWQTRHQLQYWKNTNALFEHTIEVTGENPRAEYLLGLDLENQGDVPGAMLHYRNAITSQPRVKEAFYAMARLFGQQGSWLQAAQAYTTLLSDNPDDFAANLGLATCLPHLGHTAEAITHLNMAIQYCPDEPTALNNLAWTLATSETTELRDGLKAVQLAERACKLTDYRQTIMVGTLGAAYAEAGRFDEAIVTAQKACALAAQSEKPDLLKINQHLLELYQQHKPFREITNP